MRGVVRPRHKDLTLSLTKGEVRSPLYLECSAKKASVRSRARAAASGS